MDSSRARRGALIAASLALAGGAAGVAWAHGLWLALAGALLVAAWIATLIVLAIRRPPPAPAPAAAGAERDAVAERLLLDASPAPLLRIDADTVRALNRAARRLFDTDDRALPPPAPLLDRAATHLRHAGRTWRIDRVDVGAQAVVALVDIEAEERAAEARASAELIQVLGHEVLNGLMPIVALAESGVTAALAAERDPALLVEILTTLARRAEGLQRFTEAYRALARLPPPMRLETSVTELVGDLARLFASRWPDVALTVDATGEGGGDVRGALDRDQLSQAIWALLQNAVEAAGQGGGRRRVSLLARRDAAGLAIDVVDSGPGVPPDQAFALFRPFVTTKPAGTGIGLSLARQIAQAHGGTVAFAGMAPTTIRLSIPV